MPAFFFLLFQGNRIARFHGVYARTFMCALRILPLGGSGIWRISPRCPPSACGHIRPSRPAYPRHTQPIIPLSVRPRKMPARPRGAQCGCARYRYVLSAWNPPSSISRDSILDDSSCILATFLSPLYPFVISSSRHYVMTFL